MGVDPGFHRVLQHTIIAIVVIGLFTQAVPPVAAKFTILFHVVAYGVYRFIFEWDVHYVHMYAVLFFIEVVLMLIIGKLYPHHAPWKPSSTKSGLDMTPWKYAVPFSATLITLIVITYLVFSPIGLVNGPTILFWVLLVLVVSLNILICLRSIKQDQAR